jgi:hypothetical protein
MDNLLGRLLSIPEVYQITDILPTFTHGLEDFAEFALGRHDKIDIVLLQTLEPPHTRR